VTAHIPHRQCAGCGRRRPQAELVRVAAPNGRAVLDRGRRLGGRGAYLCPNAECAVRAARKGSLTRRMRRSLTDVETLAERLEVESTRTAWKD
jgi:uncharacterized protein